MISPAYATSLLDSAFYGEAWHGPSLMEALRPLGPEVAARRPGAGRNTPWELALHCAYWKHRVLCRVTGTQKRFPRSPANFPTQPEEPTADAWARDVALLDDAHRKLVSAVSELSQSELMKPGPRQKRTREEHVVGIALHDAYHAGQIVLIHRLSS